MRRRKRERKRDCQKVRVGQIEGECAKAREIQKDTRHGKRDRGRQIKGPGNQAIIENRDAEIYGAYGVSGPERFWRGDIPLVHYQAISISILSFKSDHNTRRCRGGQHISTSPSNLIHSHHSGLVNEVENSVSFIYIVSKRLALSHPPTPLHPHAPPPHHSHPPPLPALKIKNPSLPFSFSPLAGLLRGGVLSCSLFFITFFKTPTFFHIFMLNFLSVLS